MFGTSTKFQKGKDEINKDLVEEIKYVELKLKRDIINKKSL